MSLSIRLPIDVEDRLKNLSSLTGRSESSYITEAIRTHLNDFEDLYLAERELKAIREGKSETVPLEEVMKRYGREG
jgi:RHH-type rel operon transcriptional repressor/antitoxin RelB